MRQRIVVNDAFNDQLTQFVEDRNALVHRFLKIEGVNLTTDEGLKKGIEFTEKLSAQAVTVRKTIQGLMHAIEGEDDGEDSEEEEQYKELAKVIFG